MSQLLLFLSQSVPPKGKLLSSIKATCDPNDDKTLLFRENDNNRNDTTNNMNTRTESAIKHHIRQIDLKMKQRICKSKMKKAEIIVDESETQKRFQRMKFMGIPTTRERAIMKSQQNEIVSIVEKISKNSLLHNANDNDARWHNDKSTSNTTNLNAKIPLAGIKLKPKIPAFVYESKITSDANHTKMKMTTIDDECEQSKAISTFTRAQPRGNNPEMLRIDKSLPWIQPNINATRAKLKSDFEINGNSCNVAVANDNHATHVQHCDMKRKIEDENQSEIRRCYKNIIATKHQQYNPNNELRNDEDDDGSEMQSMQSESSLSSNGTYFTNDSGSYVVIFNEKIPKSRVNIGKKFQVSGCLGDISSYEG